MNRIKLLIKDIRSLLLLNGFMGAILFMLSIIIYNLPLAIMGTILMINYIICSRKYCKAEKEEVND